MNTTDMQWLYHSIVGHVPCTLCRICNPLREKRPFAKNIENLVPLSAYRVAHATICATLFASGTSASYSHKRSLIFEYPKMIKLKKHATKFYFWFRRLYVN